VFMSHVVGHRARFKTRMMLNVCALCYKVKDKFSHLVILSALN